MNKNLEEYLNVCISFAKQHNIKKPENGYYSIYDFILEHGKEYDYMPKPDSVKAGRAKCCFMNAYMLVSQNKEYRYVEGYGVIKSIGFPIWHAWVIDDFDQVIDNTWTDFGSYYYGTVLDFDYVEYIIDIGGIYGIIDNPDLQFPLLRGKHKYLGNGKVEYKVKL